MKSILVSIGLLIMILLIQSCTKDNECPLLNCNSGQLNVETCDCDCPIGFTGENCEIEDLCITQNVSCLNDGICLNGLCDCPVGYFGTNCENLDITQIQALLDSGQSPQILFEAGVLLDSLYGKLYNGGLIYYLDTLNGTGLIAATSDQSIDAIWGCSGIDIDDCNNISSCTDDCFYPEPVETLVGARIGDGLANTNAILGDCSNGRAAEACRDLGTAWFLPSRGELSLMYANLHLNGFGDFANEYYWSSTERGQDGHAWFLHFEFGHQAPEWKFSNGHVRAVATF